MPPKVQPGDEPFEHIDFPTLDKQTPRSRRAGAFLLVGALLLLVAAIAGRRGRD